MSQRTRSASCLPSFANEARALQVHLVHGSLAPAWAAMRMANDEAARRTSVKDGAACAIASLTLFSSVALSETRVPPILSMTPSLATARCLALVWGVHSVQTPDVSDVAEMVEH